MKRHFPQIDPQDVWNWLKAFLVILFLGFDCGLAVGMFLTGCKLALKIVP